MDQRRESSVECHDAEGVRRLQLGGVTLEWDAIFRFPIVAHPARAGWFLTQCRVVYSYGLYDFPVPIDFAFDGASIPWFIQIVPGFAAHDWHLLATLIHDYVCEHPEELPRPVGDGIFVSVMLAIAAHSRRNASGGEKMLRTVQAWLMYAAVTGYTLYRALGGGKVQLL